MQPPRFAIHPMRVIFMARASGLLAALDECAHWLSSLFACADFARAAAEAGGPLQLVARAA